VVAIFESATTIDTSFPSGFDEKSTPELGPIGKGEGGTRDTRERDGGVHDGAAIEHDNGISGDWPAIRPHCSSGGCIRSRQRPPLK